MKSKLRKIVVEGKNYLYAVKDSYSKDVGANEGFWKTTVRVFEDGRKNTPLEIVFLTKDQYAVGNPLKANHSVVRNGENHEFNIYRPWLIRLLIQEGISRSWTADDPLIINDGMLLLKELNFGISKLLPKNRILS